MSKKSFAVAAALCIFLLPGAGELRSDTGGTIRGTVVHQENGVPIHAATVLIVQLGRVTDSSASGNFEFTRVPAGNYDVVVHSAALSDERQSVEVTDGAISTLEFKLHVAPIRSEITVTASGSAQTTFEAFQAVSTLDAIDLASKGQPSIGEVLEGQSGVAKRSFGPGNTRPVIRGFDGDRVMVAVDGVAGGSIGSQSGDHGENIDVLQLERVEVVKGPATLLYGSSAIGGVVNAVTGHHQIQEHSHEGLTGYLTGTAGSGNAFGAGNAGVEYGREKWSIWSGGGGQRTGDYDSPLGTIANSWTESQGGYGGVGWYGKKGYFRLGYNYDNRDYGIPFAAFIESGGEAGANEEVVNLRLHRHDTRLTGGFRDLEGPISGVRVVLGYTDYRHGEFDGDSLGTDFRNKQLTYRVAFDQRRAGRLSGNFGVSGMRRDYRAIGDETLAPPTTHDNFALFGLETIDWRRVSLQLGGRFEHNSYAPEQDSEIPLPARSFNGLSAAAGFRVSLWKDGAFVTNYTHSYRAPALEELYNNGPHPGNLAYEIGNPELRRERADGVDMAIRHQHERIRAEVNWFYYRLSDFVYLAPTGNIVENLSEAEYMQGDSRYTGIEASVAHQLTRLLWLRGGLDSVNARLTKERQALPRIPPVRGRVGLDLRWKNLSVMPEAVMARSQNNVFPTETRTAGYALFNLNASYVIAGQHAVHVFAVETFNLGDRLYRNHLSFIKDLAPEIGRGVRFSYTLRFF